ncbi:hypothetical protein LOD99_10694 [Oopsacas minuta]|uniref:Uncharacterized protein n=1 Tax=Oopsacas minuta TaxID=111878 RepID=A0AAV7KGA4_9METZ|nr:hypothetical protein LOD99_10694 [Oopsacas minuta]
MSRCKGLLERHANHGLETILFSDEKIFTIQEVTNSQNDRITSATRSSISEKYRYVSHIQRAQSVMVWAPLIFVPPGVKLNATTYRDLILEPVLQNLGETMFNGEPFIFQ